MDFGQIAKIALMGAVPVVGPYLQAQQIGGSGDEGPSDSGMTTLSASHSSPVL